MTFALAFNILNATLFPVSVPVIILASLLFLFIFAVAFNNQYTFLIALGFITAAALFIFMKWDDSWLSETTSAVIPAYIRDLIAYIRGYGQYKDSFSLVITFAVCGFLALYMTLSLYVSFQFYFASLLGIGAFVVNWLMAYKRSDIAFVIFIFCFCAMLYKKLNKKKPDVNRTAIYMTPVFLLVITCAYFLPSINSAWNNSAAVEFLKDPLAYTNDFFYFIFNPKYFSFQATGFESAGGRLGGNLALNNRQIMSVKADSPVYMAGLIKDVYNGNAWQSGKPGFTPYNGGEASLEATETRINLPLFILSDASSYPRDLMSVRELTVNIGESRTGTIFRPMKNSGVNIDTDLDLLTDSYGDIRLSDVLPAGAEYSFSYMDIDYSNQSVLNTLRQSHRGMYQEALDNNMYVDFVTRVFEPDSNGRVSSWSSGDINPLPVYQALLNQQFTWGMWEYLWRSRSMASGGDLADFFKNKLIPYADDVYNTFLQLPDTLPARVKDLARQITAAADNDYGRAKAIESYLVEIPYTLTPGATPLDRDFVDYFLFDGREGYCTYYASAMVVMCRSIGLPARYVEGYVTPPEKTDGVYSVTNLEAHAWPEVYFEGFGWVPFEPTAPYSYNYYQTAPAPEAQVFTPDFASRPEYEQYRDSLMGGNAAVPPIISRAPSPAAQPVKMASAAAAAILIFAIAMLALACFGAMLLGGRYGIWRRQNYIRRLPRNEQAIEYFHDIIKMTAYHKYPMLKNETPTMYAKRIGKRFAFKNDTIFIRDLAAVYNRAKYGGGHIRREDLSLMRNSRDELVAFFRHIKARPVFIWNRYITRKI